jgi:hypothetical protein
VSSLEVDPAVLQATGRRLRAAVEVARDVRREHSSLVVLATDAGHDRLSGTVQTFLEKWAHGIGCLIEDADTLAAMLTDAGTTYRRVETSIARACEPGG